MRVAATRQGVRRALVRIVAELRRTGVNEAHYGTVEIVLAEAMNNVVEHAYSDRTGGEIRLLVAHGPEGTLLQLRDRGAPLDWVGEQPYGRPPHPETLPEGGFGWPLIRLLSENCHYQRRNGENCLSITISLS
ncbi:serine/threonine-protein kinase RsbW [Rhodovulum imhoffii]|uniref:Serine/threonine-protein kinase RsbW n=2 Tax=Rhodovulum imhoffii TaxID=365340 RepID=A0A2T5BV25_9RHOB|nr:serine/threonine-protein kinase RsbW [Rhodovulum imhoffii]